MLCATLARVRRPATGRLNSSVRRQKAFGSCIVGAATYRLRSALLFGLSVGTSLLRSSSSGLRFSESASVVQRRGVPSRLTSRSSRPRVVASATCFALRLHVSAAPPQGGLTPALGGRKAFFNCVARRPDFLASVGTDLRSDCRHVASSAKSTWRAHTSHALRWPASEAVIVICGFAASDPLLRRRPTEGWRGALNHPVFGFRQGR